MSKVAHSGPYAGLAKAASDKRMASVVEEARRAQRRLYYRELVEMRSTVDAMRERLAIMHNQIPIGASLIHGARGLSDNITQCLLRLEHER